MCLAQYNVRLRHHMAERDEASVKYLLENFYITDDGAWFIQHVGPQDNAETEDA